MTHPLARLSHCPALCLFPSLIILILPHTFIPISQILATRILSSLETTRNTRGPHPISYIGFCFSSPYFCFWFRVAD